MDYKEKYEQALERARQFSEKPYLEDSAGIVEYIFPELKESEDEKTKRILHSISSKMSFHLCDIFTEEEFQCFDTWSNAWLEKKGEKILTNSAITCKDKQKSVFEMKTPEESLGIDSDTYNKIVDECIYGEQKSSWSEEDKRIIDNLVSQLGNLYARKLIKEETKDKYVNWLKSLKDRYTWKPSDEQMEAVRIAAEIGTANNSWAMGILKGLYQDLKKLREE